MLCVIFILLYGCQSEKNSIKNENSHNGATQSTSSTAGPEIGGHREIRYMTFEELLAVSTDVVIATYQDSFSGKGYLDQRFVINERLLGEDKGEEIRIYNRAYQTEVTNTGLSFKYTDLEYQKGAKYLLVLERFVSVYSDDAYLLLGNIYIPYDEVQKSTVYGETLQNHSNLNLSADGLLKETLRDYVLEKTKNNTKLFTGNDYIKSDKLEDIVSGSPFLVKVRIGDPSFTEAEDRKTYECEIVELLKGDIPQKTIQLILLNGTVVIGNEYIVAIDAGKEPGYSYFLLSARNGVFEMSKADEIEALIK